MRLLGLFLLLAPVLSYADMGGLDFGVGQNSRPLYSVDYEFNKDGTLPYLDVALSANQDYVQPYVSGGLQFEHINVGLAAAVSLSGYHDGAFTGQLSVGPELGYMYNLTQKIYVKENNSYMGFDNQFSFMATFSIGLNF